MKQIFVFLIMSLSFFSYGMSQSIVTTTGTTNSVYTGTTKGVKSYGSEFTSETGNHKAGSYKYDLVEGVEKSHGTVEGFNDTQFSSISLDYNSARFSYYTADSTFGETKLVNVVDKYQTEGYSVEWVDSDNGRHNGHRGGHHGGNSNSKLVGESSNESWYNGSYVDRQQVETTTSGSSSVEQKTWW